MDIQIDPEFRALIPPLTNDERKQLEANLKVDGCREPLVLWKGLLLDGHHRFDICTREKLVYRTVEVSCADRDDAKAWIIRQQFGRRNLQPFQRAELALVLKPLLATEAKRRQSHGLKKGTQSPVRQNSDAREKSKTWTSKKLATIAKVSHDTLHRAAVIKAKASPDVQQALREGKTTINREYKKIKASPEPTFDGRRVLQEIEQHITKEWAICSIAWRVRFLEHGRLLYERLAKEEAIRRANAPGITVEFTSRPRHAQIK